MIKKQLSDKSVVEAYPLTQAQRTMYFVYNQYGKNSAVLNIAAGHYWKGDFDKALLKDALLEAMSRCDTMFLRFSPDNQYGLVQYLAPEHEIEICEEDFSSLTMEEATYNCKQWAKTGIDYIEKPLHTVKIMHMPEGYNGFFLKLHHLAFDGYSTKVFISDVMAIYLHKKCGTPYPKPMRLYLEAMTQELSYFNSDREKLDKQYWMTKFSTESEPIFNDYLKDNRLAKARKESGNENQRYILLWEGEHPESRTLQYDLTKEETDKIMFSCSENHFALPAVLMLGMRTALSACNGNQPDVSFKMMVHRRATLLEKKSGGNRWHLYTLRSVIEGEKTFKEAVEIMEKEQEEIFRHADSDTLTMYQIKHMAMKMEHLEQTYDSMSFSYHAPVYTPAENDEVKASSLGVWYNNDFSCQNLYLTVKHRTSDNGLTFIFEYRISENPLEDLKLMYPKIIKTIMMGIENPNITLNEILDEIKY